MNEALTNEKEELLNDILKHKSLVNEFMKYHQELNAYYTNPLAGFSIGPRLITWFVCHILLIVNISFMPLSIFSSIIVFCLLLFLPRIIEKIIISTNQPRIIELREQMKNIEDSVNPVFIPKVYMNQYALNKLEEYLVNKRADNLKEALNLFEQEKLHNEQMKQLNIIQHIQEDTYRKANEATLLGWVNIFKK
ncbi:hypothetical protein ACERII_18445 [Evansella sp. AB-rgal1]|uniref:hypothetical protein n=1 Tax=Evansella sp. AB-rgal1 TaxID=3242696 RepID=UPI00359D3B7B